MFKRVTQNLPFFGLHIILMLCPSLQKVAQNVKVWPNLVTLGLVHCWMSKLLFLNDDVIRETLLKGRLSTVDLLVLTSFDQMLLKMKVLLTFY